MKLSHFDHFRTSHVKYSAILNGCISTHRCDDITVVITSHLGKKLSVRKGRLLHIHSFSSALFAHMSSIIQCPLALNVPHRFRLKLYLNSSLTYDGFEIALLVIRFHGAKFDTKSLPLYLLKVGISVSMTEHNLLVNYHKTIHNIHQQVKFSRYDSSAYPFLAI